MIMCYRTFHHENYSIRVIVKMSATANRNHGMSIQTVKPPSHPTYDLKGVIKLALAEDARDRGLTAPLPFWLFCKCAMANAASPAYILETRKMALGLRLVEKWAVLIGGGRDHIMGLFDMFMIKDNHISIAGGVKNALRFVDLYLEENNLHGDEVVFSVFKVFSGFLLLFVA
ncbi:nicotinate-nucleotide pyrophosphorylase [carboxylating], chloroplastic-like [Actinidia eriantha]|uniref:nicotinate-nucleotide pyrophosphorylase [carboxylating], chloroplastic-like n=1 Tax=Actinidia eriantha TaxID=165200 RepID=UPI002589E5A4|nr:nicotinate-nucleotide pyrophosphorylase [carboxylating], chloroplastic-like [Actinidia eriantha]